MVSLRHTCETALAHSTCLRQTKQSANQISRVTMWSEYEDETSRHRPKQEVARPIAERAWQKSTTRENNCRLTSAEHHNVGLPSAHLASFLTSSQSNKIPGNTRQNSRRAQIASLCYMSTRARKWRSRKLWSGGDGDVARTEGERLRVAIEMRASKSRKPVGHGQTRADCLSLRVSVSRVCVQRRRVMSS